MRGRIGHSPPTTGSAEAAALAGIRDNAIPTAGIAVNANKSMRQNAAFQKRTQFALHKPGNHPVALLLPGQKSLEILRYDPVQDTLFRTAWSIDGVRLTYQAIRWEAATFLLYGIFTTIGPQMPVERQGSPDLSRLNGPQYV